MGFSPAFKTLSMYGLKPAPFSICPFFKCDCPGIALGLRRAARVIRRR
jgi:hypothetical protein